MSFTKIAAAGISSTGIITLENISVSGVTTSSGGFVGNLTGNATGLSGTPNITVGSITAVSASFSGNISVAGTVTYEDVTNVDSVGVITARSGIVVSSGSTAAPSISPQGDSNTGISFPSPDTVAIVEGGAEVLRVNSSGFVGVGTVTPSSTMDVYGQQANTGSTSAVSPTGTLRLAFDGASAGGSYGSSLVFSQRWFSGTNAQTAVGQIAGVKIAGEGNFGGGLALFTSNGSSNNLLERIRIDSSGNLGIGTNNPVVLLDVFKTSYPELNVRTGTITGTYGIDTATNTLVVGSTTTHPLSIRTNGTERINLASTGNSTFYTNSTFDASNYFYLQNNTNSYGRIGLVIRGKTFNGANTPSANDSWSLSSGRSTVRFEAYLTGDTDYDPKFSIQHLLAASTNAAIGDLGFLAKGYSSSTPAMVLTAGGNFGIGIASPSQKLSISSAGAVRNEIICTDNNAGGAGVYLRTLNSGTQVSNATLRTTNNGTFEVYTGTSSETIKLSIDTSGNLITPDNIGGGLSIGYKKVVTITGNFTANTWYNTGIDRTTDTGIYLLNAWVDTYATGQSYQETYIGWFVIANRATNSSVADVITLHRNGHAPNGEVLQFRTLRTPSSIDGRTYLQWLSNVNLNLDGSGGRNIQVAIHRLATAFNN